MSSQPFPNGANHDLFLETGTSPENQALSFLLRDIGAPLTVIKGHAQLIRRRATTQTREEAVLLDQSIAAIELAVQRIIVSLGESATKITVNKT